MTGTPPPPTIEGLEYLGSLGSGGYADVHLYERRVPRRRVAVKVMRSVARSAADMARFTTEADAMAQLEHPNIVPVYSAGVTSDGRPYLEMMFYPRASLAERVKQERIPVAEVLRIGIQISSAVETAHRAGLLHRDIKPANILTSQYGAPGLTDFGIAAQISAIEDDETGVSVPWSPTETLYATAPASVRSDVYSLAATLWHLLVGRSPFEISGGDNSTFALMRRVRDVPPPSTGRPDVPTSLDRLLRTALAKQPQLRPDSALALARSLQAIEQELRLPRTEIVLAADTASRTPNEVGTTRLSPRIDLGSEADDRTRLRGAVVVDVQHQNPNGLPAVPGPSAASASAGTTPGAAVIESARPDVVLPSVQTAQESDEPATVLRGGVVRDAQGVGGPPAAPGQPWPEEHESADRPRRGVGWIIAIAVAVVVVGLVVFAMTHDWGTAVSEPSSTPSVAPPELGSVGAPGVPEITASRDGDNVTFTWTYDNQLDSDSYVVRVTDGAGGGALLSTERIAEATLSIESPDERCVSVRAYREDGSNLPKEYSKETCG